MSNSRYLIIGMIVLTVFIFAVRSASWYTADQEIPFSDFLTSLEAGENPEGCNQR